MRPLCCNVATLSGKNSRIFANETPWIFFEIATVISFWFIRFFLFSYFLIFDLCSTKKIPCAYFETQVRSLSILDEIMFLWDCFVLFELSLFKLYFELKWYRACVFALKNCEEFREIRHLWITLKMFSPIVSFWSFWTITFQSCPFSKCSCRIVESNIIDSFCFFTYMHKLARWKKFKI